MVDQVYHFVVRPQSFLRPLLRLYRPLFVFFSDMCFLLDCETKTLWRDERSFRSEATKVTRALPKLTSKALTPLSGNSQTKKVILVTRH